MFERDQTDRTEEPAVPIALEVEPSLSLTVLELEKNSQPDKGLADNFQNPRSRIFRAVEYTGEKEAKKGGRGGGGGGGERSRKRTIAHNPLEVRM